MTTRRRKPRPISGKTLNNTILLGTVLATGLGAQMLAVNDDFSIEMETATPAPIIITQTDGTELLVDIAPMAELIVPEPVTRTRSSR